MTSRSANLQPHHPAVPTPVSSRLSQRQQLGQLGEHMAARYLEMRGYRVLARNWRHSHGELDLVITDGTTVIAVEVKTRTSNAFGHPLESITPVKLRRLKTLLSLWCAENHPLAKRLRVDAIAILGEFGSRRTIDHREGIG